MGCASSTESEDQQPRERYEVKSAVTTTTKQQQDVQQQQHPNPAAKNSNPVQRPADPDTNPEGRSASTSDQPKADAPVRADSSSQLQQRETAPVITIPKYQPQRRRSSGGQQPPPATGQASSAHDAGAPQHGHRSPTQSSAYLTASGVSTPGEEVADNDAGVKPPFGRFIRGACDEPDPVSTGEVWSMKGAIGTDMPMNDFVGSTPEDEPLSP